MIKNVTGVESVHHTHIWSMDGEHHSLTAHIVVSQKFEKNNIMPGKISIATTPPLVI